MTTFRDAGSLPTKRYGTEGAVVTERPFLSVGEQEERLAHLAVGEWHVPFDALAAAIAEYPAEVDMQTVSDDELVALVHRLRGK